MSTVTPLHQPVTPSPYLAGALTACEGLADTFDRMAAKHEFAPEAAGLKLAAEFIRKYGEGIGESVPVPTVADGDMRDRHGL